MTPPLLPLLNSFLPPSPLLFHHIVTAGTPLTITITPYDAYGNPTMHSSDAFYYYVKENINVSSDTVTLNNPTKTLTLTKAGSYSLNLVHENANLNIRTELTGFKRSVTLTPRDARPKYAQHSLNVSTVVSQFDTTLDLRVTTLEKFNNLVPDASGKPFAFQINDDVLIPMNPPDYSAYATIPAGFVGFFNISFIMKESMNADRHYLSDTMMLRNEG